MPPRRRRSEPQPAPGGLLIWSASSHWSDQARPCRYCRKLTHLRDSKRSPAHKVCAEAALAEQQDQAAAAYRAQGEL